jgi:hypothetical protein
MLDLVAPEQLLTSVCDLKLLVYEALSYLLLLLRLVAPEELLL